MSESDLGRLMGKRSLGNAVLSGQTGAEQEPHPDTCGLFQSQRRSVSVSRP